MMAMSHVNFSSWGTYTPDKQAEKATDICDEMSKGTMPPKGYKASHPDAVPTAEQVKPVCDWAGSFKKK